MAKDAKLAAADRRSLGRYRQGASRACKALYHALWHDRERAPASAPTCSAMPATWCARRQEKAKPNGERLPEYTDSRLALLSKTMLDPQPVYPELEQVALEFWLSKLRENLTADSRRHQDFPGQGFARNACRRGWQNPGWAIPPCARRCGMAAWRRSRRPTIR